MAAAPMGKVDLQKETGGKQHRNETKERKRDARDIQKRQRDVKHENVVEKKIANKTKQPR